MKNKFNAFTLAELLVVIAITIILMGLLLIPIIKTLEANKMTAAYTNAQQNSRQAMSMIRKDISEAMYVADSAMTPMLLPVKDLVDQNGNFTDRPVVMSYAVINLIMPKTQFYCSNPDHDPSKPRNFERGEDYRSSSNELSINECPYCGTEEFVSVVPKVPVEKGSTVVRYFLGLRNNEGVMDCEDCMNINSWKVNDGCGWSPETEKGEEGSENTLVLYRVEFNPLEETAFDESGNVYGEGGHAFPEEYSLKGLDRNSDEYQTRLYKRITDANVFYHPDCYKYWADRVSNVGVLEGLDLAVAGDNDYIDGHPFRVSNSVTFTPAAISGETPIKNASTTYSQDSQDFPATTFRTKYKMWSNTADVTVVRVDPKTQKPSEKWIMKNLTGNNYFGNIYKFPNPDTINPSLGAENLEFDINDYMYNSGEVSDFGQKMAFFCNMDKGYIDFAMTPVPWNELDGKINQDNLIYYPDTETYCYKFLPYDNATVVPGSENVEYYNAYWTDSNNDSFVDLNYNYADMADIVGLVRYQRSPFSTGVLNYNQYKIDYNEGLIYWKSVLYHDVANGIYPIKYADIPRIKDYKIQFNRKSDKITVSYLTNDVIDVNISMRVIWDAYKPARTGYINERVEVGNSLK